MGLAGCGTTASALALIAVLPASDLDSAAVCAIGARLLLASAWPQCCDSPTAVVSHPASAITSACGALITSRSWMLLSPPPPRLAW